VKGDRAGKTRDVAPSANSARELYADLLVRNLVDGIYGEPWDGPWRPGNKFDRGPHPQGLLGPTVAHTMVGVDRLNNVRQLTQAALDENIPGDFIETGVWRGGCCILMRGILAVNGTRDRKVYVADSFAGVPPPRPDVYPADRDLRLDLSTELAVPLAEVKENFRRYGLLDDQVVFVEGLFSNTLPALDAGPFALIRLDGDLYESTSIGLQCLYPKLSPGGFLIVDDYGVIAACRQAVDDYRTEHDIDAPINWIDRTGIWWRRPPEQQNLWTAAAKWLRSRWVRP